MIHNSRENLRWGVISAIPRVERLHEIFFGQKLPKFDFFWFSWKLQYFRLLLPYRPSKLAQRSRSLNFSQWVLPFFQNHTVRGPLCKIRVFFENWLLALKRLGIALKTLYSLERAYHRLSNAYLGLGWKCLSSEKSWFFWARPPIFSRKSGKTADLKNQFFAIYFSAWQYFW